MSQGPTLFSCGMMENGRWRDLDRKCPLQLDQPSPSIWDCLPEKGPDGGLWSREAAATCSVTSLIQDLSLSDPHGHPSAPPSKRQCRSLSFSDELSGCRTAWRPLGSKVWTPVEKRRCYSGGSVQRYSGASCPMQRSSSFSLPSRTSASASASALSSPAPSLGRWGGQPCLGAPGAAASASIQRSLSCSHERFSRSEDGPPSASSTPASTPEPARRAGGLSRSRSQPCVLNDKKAGVKRRRPDDPQEPRPSLDLAKMTQVRPPCPERPRPPPRGFDPPRKGLPRGVLTPLERDSPQGAQTAPRDSPLRGPQWLAAVLVLRLGCFPGSCPSTWERHLSSGAPSTSPFQLSPAFLRALSGSTSGAAATQSSSGLSVPPASPS
uniref:Family with sequence similarity 53 member B n=1 Tax=Monodelphis domestica TaxID=13616 RepID=F6SAZ8_MONDO